MANRFISALVILVATTPFVMGCASSIVHGEKYKTSPMDIKRKCIGANEPGFVPVLEKMPDTLMTGIEMVRVPRKQASHEGR